jgi:hypothetical protein
MYVTYDVRQKTRGGGSAIYPKVKRVYIAGDVKTWQAERGEAAYKVASTKVGKTEQRFVQVVEYPKGPKTCTLMKLRPVFRKSTGRRCSTCGNSLRVTLPLPGSVASQSGLSA